MTNLRPYQLDVLNRTRAAYKQGYRSPCIAAPCGFGKSIIVAEMARAATAKGKRVLFLVHRRELCEQIEDTFSGWGVNMRLCYIGMVQTVTRRLGKFHSPDLIITDENHHCLAASYRKIYDFFDDVPRVGVTATPVRLNGSGLGDVNDILIEGASTKWLIQNNFLAPFDYYAPDITDLSGLHIRNGEFITSEVEDRLNVKAIYGDVIKHYRQLSENKQAICYCASVKHSKCMAEEFNENGIPAAHIDGETLKGIRAHTVEMFRNGDIRILCNVDLISEGFDVPDCNTSILLRPTQSLTLFIQQSMRCMRYKPGKRAVIIDHVGNYARHGLPDDDREWSLDAKKTDKKKKNIYPVRQCPQCYMILPAAAQTCPACKTELAKERQIDEIKAAALVKIEGFVLDYMKPDDCHSMKELQAYARRMGYKPGWAWYQGKKLGFI